MNAKTIQVALGATAACLAFAALAETRGLPTPTPGGFVDTESSVNVSLADWPDYGRRVRIGLSAPVTPTNAIQVALGQDLNGNGNLEPEETSLVMGVDCLVPFARKEGQRSEVKGLTVEFVPPSSTSTSNLVSFAFKQPLKVEDRFTHAKVTTRNMAETNAVIVADIKRPGLLLFVR